MAPQGGPGRGRSRRSSRRRRAPAGQRKERRAKGRRHRSSFAPAVGMGSTDRLAAACQGQRSVALDRRPDQQRRRKVAMVLTFSIDGACYRSLRRSSVLLLIRWMEPQFLEAPSIFSSLCVQVALGRAC